MKEEAQDSMKGLVKDYSDFRIPRGTGERKREQSVRACSVNVLVTEEVLADRRQTAIIFARFPCRKRLRPGISEHELEQFL